MPYKPRKPCAFRGCRELTSDRYCEAHKKQVVKDYNKNSRDKASNKRYGRKWRAIREAFLAANPLCEMCKGAGKLTPADTVHHLVRLADGGTHESDNLQALCHECHSRLHANEGDYF